MLVGKHVGSSLESFGSRGNDEQCRWADEVAFEQVLRMNVDRMKSRSELLNIMRVTRALRVRRAEPQTIFSPRCGVAVRDCTPAQGLGAELVMEN